ncbi:MAG: ATP-dependent helicase HrpB [Acidimicrobiia bacterium]|nr:ATP-dependent helicase HrpB [Acidimicrobiia bacterium]
MVDPTDAPDDGSAQSGGDEGLPVEEVVPDLRVALAEQRAAVLVAPPGSGKTTIVPLRLLDEPWLDGRRILVLEPRRLATRAAAHRMASLLDERVGRTVGFTTRDDRATSAETRIEVVTEGILTRRLQNDPELSGVGAILFDEFHERNLQTDLGLALALDVAQSLRPDLRLLLMSATIDADRISGALSDHLDEPVPVLTSASREHPIDISYRPVKPPGGGRRQRRPRQNRRDLAAQVTSVIHRALDDELGDMLVFLPGIGEINAVATELDAGGVLAEVHRLHGGLSLDEQDAALQPSMRRKVVLSTDIAETSLTVEGVRIVVDSGVARKPRFDTRTGMTRLQTVSISQASADQRAGRAGRTEPGVAYRLWSKMEHAGRDRQRAAEITQVDLTGLVLELRAWGLRGPESLFFLDRPPAGLWAEAEELLDDLGALDDSGLLNALGHRMVSLPAHPRLARMILEAETDGDQHLACMVAALLDERDPLAGNRPNPPADLGLRVQLLAGNMPRHDLDVDRRALRRVLRTTEDLLRRSGLGGRVGPADRVDAGRVGRVLALAFPDRLAVARGSRGRFQLRTGTTAWVADGDSLSNEQFLVAADLDGKRADARIRLAGALDQVDVFDRFERRIETQVKLVAEDGRVMEHRVSRIGGVVLAEAKRRAEPGEEAAAVLGELIRRDFDLIDWGGDRAPSTPRSTKTYDKKRKGKRKGKGKGSGVTQPQGNRASSQRSHGNGLRYRVMALRDRFGEPWPDWTDEGLLASLDTWLGPSLLAATSIDEVNRLDPNRMLERSLDPALRAEMQRLAPTHLELPGGRRLPIDYRTEGPTVSSRAQDFYGLNRQPEVAGEPVVVELLSPAQRPIQTTRDLPGFWSGTWSEVRAEMAGRYPKHDWPEDPSQSA